MQASLSPRHYLFIAVGLGLSYGLGAYQFGGRQAAPPPPAAGAPENRQAPGVTTSSPRLTASELGSELTRLQTMPPSDERDFLLSKLVQAWMKQDPAAAAKVLAEEDPQGNLSGLYNEVGREWALRDGPSAAAWASKLQNPELLDTATRGVCEAWAIGKPTEALTWLNTLPKGDVRENGLVQVAQVWAQTNPRSALNAISQNPQDPANQRALGELAAAWGRSSPKDAALALAASGLTNADQLAIQAVMSGSLEHPAEALQSLSSIRDSGLRAQTRQTLLQAAALANPQSALQYLSSTGPINPADAESVASGWAANNPKAALEWAATAAPNAYPAAATAAYSQDASNLQTILRNGPPSLQWAAIQQISAFEVQNGNPDKALEILKQAPPSPQRDQAIQQLNR